MCGIFGVLVKNENQYTKKDIQNFLEILFKLSESRGKEAAGLAVKRENSLNVLKLPIAAADFLKSSEYKRGVKNGSFGPPWDMRASPPRGQNIPATITSR